MRGEREIVEGGLEDEFDLDEDDDSLQVAPLPVVLCIATHASHVTCHTSHIACHTPHVTLVQSGDIDSDSVGMRPDAARGKRQPARPQQPDEESFEGSDGIGSEVSNGVVCVLSGG